MRNYAALLLLSVVLVSCHNMFGRRVHGNGVQGTQERTVSNFQNVHAGGAIKLYVTQGDLKPVKLEGDENLLQYIDVSQSGDDLEISTRHGYNLQPTGDIKVYVTAPVFRELEVSGASDLIGLNKITSSDKLKLAATGAGDITMELDAPAVDAEISGAGNLQLKGQAKDVDIDLTGASNAKCFDLLAENIKVDISGAGDAEVYASVKLEAQVSGAGTVSYKGNASQINQHISGAGSINKVQ